MSSLLRVFAGFLIASAAFAQTGTTIDSSGNGRLQGTFRFRQLAVTKTDTNGDPTEMTAVTGTIAFDGKGNYSLTGSYINNAVANGAPQTLNIPSCATASTGCGKYSIGANGFGYVANPLAPSDSTNWIWGATAQGVFTGSDTENGGIACPGRPTQTCTLFDLFVAIPDATLTSNAGLSSTYQLGLIDFTSGNSAAIRNALGQMAPDGAGNFGQISLSGQLSTQSGTTLAQNTTGATYRVNADSSITWTLPLPTGVSSAAQALASGTRTLYRSADGNFLLGFTPTGYDMILGIKAPSSASQADFQRLYFNAALEDTPVNAGVSASYGSMSASGTDAVVHQRLVTNFYYAYDYISDNVIRLASSGTAGPDYNGYRLRFGNGGIGYVAIGSSGFFSLQLGLQTPVFTGSGVFLNPVGVVNAASYAPITASLAPGELITLFGSGLAPATLAMQGGQAFPTTLGGVQVRINGVLCAIYYISPGQIAVIVPYELPSTASLADIQISNNGTLSNVVQMWVQSTAPGVFSQTQNGVGLAAALHASTGAVVTNNTPAAAGEYLSLFLTGLGAVTPTVQTGALGPAPTLSNANVNTNGNLYVLFNDYTSGSLGVQGKITYAGLAPGLAGLYQINVQVPAGFTAGDAVYLEIVTDVVDINEIQIPVK